MSADPNEAAAPEPRRRWPRYTLRTLLLVMAVLCVVLAIVGRDWYLSYMEQQALAELKKAGGITVTNQQGAVDRVYLAGDRYLP